MLKSKEKIKSLNPNQIVIFITAFGSISLAVDAVKKGAYDFIEKPFDNDKLILTVSRAIEHSRLKKEITVLHNRLSATRQTIIGESFALKQLLAQIHRAAKTDVTVLIYGESGTGKELIAKTLHENSARFEKPFVAINFGGRSTERSVSLGFIVSFECLCGSNSTVARTERRYSFAG
ncbi:MAG: sigma 54-interacting transcriptional regulator [Candidatus Azobacteroides sp.]|nr:sigma 54-interacting transcriptional regulator [Candidatus Azobacteroides sp.]